MDVRRKLTILADAAKYDASCASSGSKRKGRKDGLGSTQGMGICHSYTPDGRCVSLLKILLTNFCIYDCHYCVSRLSSDVERARFTPAEVANLTVAFYRRNYIEGLFLSSGVIKSPDYTMEQLIEVARLLREEHRFFGYIHLKAVPGASPELLELASQYADRMSANLEQPTDADLQRLAPEKSLAQIEGTMSTVRGLLDEAAAETSPHAPRVLPSGQSTQVLVGASAASDRVLLATSHRLYDAHRLRRVYYSAYSPIPGADPRLPPAAPPLAREHRLYQADWLMRFYGFDDGELTLPEQPDLDLEIDPKLAWALRHREQFPVDLNTAPREMLLRIPGLGVKSVERILTMRPHRAVRLDDLGRLGVVVGRARAFVQTADHN
ncbi:MAG: putative DNA modification/repair radical SAM protein, partial [Myxococcales bacterium]